MTLVPIVTLLFGYFPIALNFWTVVGITVYYISLNFLTYYCTSLKHFTALWLSNMATTIMFWPFLKAALFTPIKSCLGQGLTFKSTQKGGMAASASFKELGPSSFLVLMSLMALIVGFLDFNVNVNAPKAIALCWVVFNMIPHTLLLIYASRGQGTFLNFTCKVFMFLSTFVGLLALILLWLLYAHEESYVRAADLSLNYLAAMTSAVNCKLVGYAWTSLISSASIWEHVTFWHPSVMMSPVRNPASKTALTAFSSRSATPG